MKSPFTAEQIEVRERIWRASQEGMGVALLPSEVSALWESILATGRELTQRRELSTQARDLEPGARIILDGREFMLLNITCEDWDRDLPVNLFLCRGGDNHIATFDPDHRVLEVRA